MIKLTKLQSVLCFIALLILMYAVGYLSVLFVRHSASLQIKEATPKQLAEAMQGDHFYADYPQTMLLVTGIVSSVSKQNNHTLAEFQVNTNPSVLPKVTCDFQQSVSFKKGNTIRILTVAYNAQRQHVADVSLQNCYLLDSNISK